MVDKNYKKYSLNGIDQLYLIYKSLADNGIGREFIVIDKAVNEGVL
jgi:hypothetical protein